MGVASTLMPRASEAAAAVDRLRLSVLWIAVVVVVDGT